MESEQILLQSLTFLTGNTLLCGCRFQPPKDSTTQIVPKILKKAEEVFLKQMTLRNLKKYPSGKIKFLF